jgi:hypothetical protein
MPIAFYRCKVCSREHKSHAEAEECENKHLTPVFAKVKCYGIHKFPYSVDVTFSSGETQEYVAYNANY